MSPHGQLICLRVPFYTARYAFYNFCRGHFGSSTYTRCASTLVHRVRVRTSDMLRRSTPVRTICFNNNAPSTLSARSLTEVVAALQRGLPLTPSYRVAVRNQMLGFSTRQVSTYLSTKTGHFSVNVRSFGDGVHGGVTHASSNPATVTFVRDLIGHSHTTIIYSLLFNLPNRSTRA